MHTITSLKPLIPVALLALLLLPTAGWAQEAESVQLAALSLATADGAAAINCGYCRCCDGPCSEVKTTGSASPPNGYEELENCGGPCVSCPGKDRRIMGDAMNAIWLAVIEGDETSGELDNLLREYKAFATLNAERNSVQLSACGALVANIPLAGLQAGDR